MPNTLKKLVGQDHLKRKFGFYLAGFKAGEKIPPILLKGAKGLGKTEFAKRFGREVKNPFLEINCGTIGNVQKFFEQIYMPAIMDRSVTVLFDEAHKLPAGLVNVMLTVFNSGNHKRTTVEVGESRYEFDFMRQTFLFATTEFDQLFDPFKDRLTHLDFRPYSVEELGRILKLHSDYVKYTGGVLNTIAHTLRGNARAAVNTAQEILRYCEIYNTSEIGPKEWKSLCEVVGIQPHGLSDIEVEILTILRDRGDCTLTMLCAATGLSRRAIQREAEIFLLRKGFMQIDNKRKLTTNGAAALKDVEQTK